MSDSNKQKEDMENTKTHDKKLNIDAIANFLIKIQNENHQVKSEFINLKKIIKNSTQDISGLRAQINELKALGARGTIGGTGSTVNLKEE